MPLQNERRQKKVDDGVLLLVAKNDRTLRIEVGYGLEGAITDVQAGRIISERITPQFRLGNFYGGIQAGVDSLVQLIDAEKNPESATASTPVDALPAVPEASPPRALPAPVVGTSSTASCAPLLASRAASCCSRCWRWSPERVAVRSVTRAVNAGIGGTSAQATRLASSSPAPSSSRRMAYCAGCGLPKSTFGAVEMAASFSTLKFALGL